MVFSLITIPLLNASEIEIADSIPKTGENNIADVVETDATDITDTGIVYTTRSRVVGNWVSPFSINYDGHVNTGTTNNGPSSRNMTLRIDNSDYTIFYSIPKAVIFGESEETGLIKTWIQTPYRGHITMGTETTHSPWYNA